MCLRWRKKHMLPQLDDFYAKVRFQLKTVKFPNSNREKVLSDWGEMAEELLQGESIIGTSLKTNKMRDAWADIEAKVNQASSEIEKAMVISDYLLNTIRVVDQYGVYSMNIKKAFDQKSASPSEMNLMAVNLLRQAGLKAYPALTSTRSHGKVLPLYPIYDQFNYAIGLLQVGDNVIPIDLYSAVVPVGYLSTNTLNYSAWIVDKDLYQWVNVPYSKSGVTTLSQMEYDDEGVLTCGIKFKNNGL